MSDKVSTSVSLKQENREYLDREVHNRSAFINELIEAHRQGKSEMEEAIARHRKEQLQSELRTIEARKESVKDELEHVSKKITSEQKRKRELFEEAYESLETVPWEEDNPAIENWAAKLEMSKEELIERLEGYDAQ